MQSSPYLKGKIVLVIGGAGLLGKAVVNHCVGSGARVISADIANIGTRKNSRVMFVAVDVTDPSSLKALQLRIKKKFGRLDGVVFASYPRTKSYGSSAATVPYEDFCSFLSANVGGSFEAIRVFSALMKKGGSIVMLNSIYGIHAPRFEIYKGTAMTVPAEYAAAKGALISLTRYFAALLGKKNIRVNSVAPGGIANKQNKTFVWAYSDHVKLGAGMLTPDDITGSVTYLLSDASRKVTGQNIIVDAGWTL